MKGHLIVCEGLDCAGKTTAIKELLKSDSNLVYSKALGSNTFIGKLAKRFPSSLSFMLEIIYINWKFLRPRLKENKIILQDRYDLSVASYVPVAGKWHNKLAIKLLRKFITKPDALAYFHVPKKERIKRLKKDDTKHHLALVENSSLITLREKEYQRYYSQFKKHKAKINTKECSIKDAAENLKKLIEQLK